LSPSPTATLSPRLRFLTDYRRALAAKAQDISSTDGQLVRLGRAVCLAREGGASQASLMRAGGNTALLNRLAERDLCPQFR